MAVKNRIQQNIVPYLHVEVVVGVVVVLVEVDVLVDVEVAKNV